MDPISIVGLASAIAQLADASFKIINVLNTIKDGNRERQKLCNEITLLWMVLRDLETQFAPLNAEQNGSWMAPIDSLAEPNGVFDQLKTALDEVWEKITTSDSKRGRIKQTIRWPFDQSYVDRTIARIERLKSSISIVTSQANIALAHEFREKVFHVQQTVSDNQFKSILDWLSPLNCREKQENITATPGTGSWFFTNISFQSWMSAEHRWLWCYGIPGAGKTYLASNTVNELRRLHKSEDALVLIVFCSYDTADSQSVDNLVTSLLKQVVQYRKKLPDKLHHRYREHLSAGTRPKIGEVCEMLSEAIVSSSKTFIILDALDELTEDSKRTSILHILYNLGGRPKIMVTSRKIESIASRFGVHGVMCDGCSKESLEVYHHCEECADFDYCENCREDGEPHEHFFVKRYSSTKKVISASPEDIENYITRRIEVEEVLHGIVQQNRKLRDLVLDRIIKNAQDMFLLARFHMDALADCLTAGEIEDALDSLPQGINDTYDQVMRRVEKLSFNRRRAVKRLLQWVSYAKRPLTIRELEHAIAVSRGVQELHADHIINAKVLTSLSAGIVIVDENERVRLTHKTAEDYFIQRRAAFFLNGDVDITECCLAYLQLAGFESGPCEEPNQSAAFQLRLKDYPFYEYASVYWGDHAQACDPAVITPQALMFLRNKPLLEASVQALCYLDTTSVNSWDVAGGIDALHLVSFFGLTDIVAHLLHEGADPNTLDPLGTTPLIYACAKGHTQVAETLLQEGALPHTVDLRGSTALLRSVQNSHFDLTRRILLENDVAINTLYKSVKNYTALMLACWNSDAQTLKLLLQRPEIDVNVSNPSSGTTALIMSALEGEMECVELLVRHPAIDINQQDHSGYTATHYAALYGYVASLELLLKAGADTSVRDDDGGRALQRAIDYGSIDTVKLLLHHNAEYDFKDSLGRTIIHAAAVNNQAKVLEHILQTCKDLNVDSQGNQGETALHDAARHGYTPTVEVLLKFGARTDIVNNAGETPVKLARDADWTEVLDALRKARTREIESSENIKTMLLRKADTFVVKSETSLATAVQFDTFEAIKTRIERASLLELNDPSSEFNSTSLHCACEYGRPEVVTLLLEAGAFVDPMDSFSRTPLIIACQSGETNIVRSLLEYGADPNHAKFGNRKPWEIALGRRATRTALFLLAQPQTEIDADSRLLSKALTWAAALGDLKACKRLVEGGAPLYLKNSDGVTPAQIAKEWYQHEVERYLLEQDAKYRTALRLDFPNTGSSKVEEIMNDGPDEGGHPPTRPPATKKELIKLTAPPDSQDILLDLNTKEQGVFQRGRTQASLILAFVLLSGLLLAILATVLLSEVKVLPP